MNPPIAVQRAIVTGATGPIGYKLIDLLIGKGICVCAVLNPASARNAALPESPLIRAISCGLQGLAELNLQEPCDAFFHLGWVGAENRAGRNDASRQAVNIMYALDAARLAARSGCKVFVGVGSQAEYGRLPDGVARLDSPTNPVEAYGVAKFAAGRLSAGICREAGIRHCWGRVLSVYGEYDRPTTLIMYTVISLMRGENPKFTPCEQLWDYLYSGDCAEALYHMALSGSEGAAYPLGGGAWRPLKEYLEEIRRRIRPDARMGYSALPYPEGQIMRMRADMSTLEADTGYRPHTDFAEGVLKLIAMYAYYNER